MAEQIKVPGVLRPGTGDYHSYAKDIIDDQLRNKKQSELNALFNQGKGIDKNGNIVPVAGGEAIDADDISYTEKVSPDNHKTGSMGKKVKELEDRINDLVPGEEYVSDTVIDLIDYMLDGSTPQSFTYDSDTKYVYSGKVTTMCTYARNNTSYAAFKVVDIDKYIVYTIYDNTFTYYNELNSETLPNEARSKFELGKYALVKQLEGKTGDSWVDGKVGVFVDSSNRPMSFRYVSSVEIYGQTLNNVLLGKTADGTNIYVYNLSSGLFKFNNRISPNDSAFEALNNLIVGASVGDITGAAVNGSEVPKNGTILQFPTYPTSGTMSYSDSTNYDAGSIGKAVKDAKVAVNVSFDDSLTQLSTQENPINNVQTAIQLLATKIYGYSSTLIITLTYNNGIRVVNTVINISAVFQGNEYDFSSQLNDANNVEYVATVDNIKKFRTNSSGECRIGLPIGATYELTFSDINNYIKPEPITGITDSTQIIIGTSYQAVSDYETVILKVVVRGVSGYVTPSGKKVYIDTYNQNNTSVVDIEGLYEITLNANGVPNTVKIKEGSSYTAVTDKVIKIDKGILYKVRLDDWDDTGAYTKSTSPLFNAQKINRGVTLAYTYTLSGTYLLLKDLESEDGYKNYRILEIDNTNNKIKIAREINGVTNNYWIYKNSNDVYIYEESQDISTAYAWFEGINIDANNPIVGIGFRSQLLNTASSSARAISGTCAFCIIPYNIANVTAGALRENGAGGTTNSSIDGLANEESWLEAESPTSVITKNIHNITASIGNNTYNAFLPAYRQLEAIIQNIDNINLIFSIFNKSLVIALVDANRSNLWSSTANYGTNVNGLGANGWNKNMTLVGTSYCNFAYQNYRSVPVFPY